MQNSKIGALWSKIAKDGKTRFYSGQLEIDGKKISIVCFHNKEKNETNRQPDYHILLSQPKQQPATPEMPSQSNTPPEPQQDQIKDLEIGNIPF